MIKYNKQVLSRLQHVRYISIQQPHFTPTNQPVDLSDPRAPSNIDNLPSTTTLTPSKHLSDPTFKSIGTPQSTLSVTIPPSLPVYIRKGSLMSIYSSVSSTSTSNAMSSKLELKQPIRRFLLGGFTSAYQRLISTAPIQILVSAYSGRKRQAKSTKSFCNLALDGTVDWTIFKTKALHVYVGKSLNVRNHRLPKKLSGGLFSENKGYTLLNGRGWASLVGNGTIFKVGLGEAEEIWIRRGNLLACSVKDTVELSQDYFKVKDMDNGEKFFNENKEKEGKSIINPDEITAKRWYSYLMEYFIKFTSILKEGKDGLYDTTVGNGEYVLIKGPRMVLIETGSGLDKFVYQPYGKSISKLEQYIRNENEWKKPRVEVGDNLSVVKFENGKIEYKNTKDFGDEVNRIEGLMKEK